MAKPFGGSGPPAALFHYSRDRGGTHPRGHPAGWSGILQADAYAGFNGLYAKGRAPAPLTEASCWAHGGARFFELADLAKAMRAPMAIEAVRRIDGNRRREADETYIGGKERNKHVKKKLKAGRGAVGKTAVAGVRDRATGHVVAKVVEKTDARTLQGFVATHTAEGAQVYTDDAKAYQGIDRPHETVRHSVGEYVREQAHTNGLESFWAPMKRTHPARTTDGADCHRCAAPPRWPSAPAWPWRDRPARRTWHRRGPSMRPR